MSRRSIGRYFALAAAAGLMLGASACNWSPGNTSTDEERRQRAEKTREEVAKATERLKPEIQEAGRKLGEAARTAGEDARAAAQGMHDGWKRGANAPLDLNTASERELMSLPGVTQHEASRIIRNRPYRSKRDLISRGIVPESTYSKIEDEVTAR
jgi:DNA uptake protein ComE-like DNA-binding protein